MSFRIFGHEGAEAEDITYVNWLSLLLNGSTKALEFYNPDTQVWMQVALFHPFSFFFLFNFFTGCRLIRKLVMSYCKCCSRLAKD